MSTPQLLQIDLYDDSPTGHGGKNWVTKAGGLPGPIRARYRALRRKHPEWTREHCYAVAVNAVKYSAATGDSKLPGKQNQRKSKVAAHRGAAAKWTAMKAKSGGKKNLSISELLNDFDIDLARTGSGDTKTKLDDKSREKYANKGNALSDGSFPINNEQDLRNAIQSLGRADPSKRDKVKAHIRKRAKELGVSINLATVAVDSQRKKNNKVATKTDPKKKGKQELETRLNVKINDKKKDANVSKSSNSSSSKNDNKSGKMGAASDGNRNSEDLKKTVKAYLKNKKKMSPEQRKKVEARIKSSKQQLGQKGKM